MSQRRCPNGTFAYVIQSGDTFYKLAQRYGTTVDRIIAANPGVDPSRLRIGQVICIPTTEPPMQCPPGTRSYRVQAGDSLYLIARRFNVTMEAIIEANPNVDFDAPLAIGMILCIPGAPAPGPTPPPGQCPPNTFAYTIKAGDTYWKISRQYRVTVDELIAANPGVNPDNLRVGQVICVPRR